jgi:NAD(P)-dependent dehydrogenase (short-subunit alcohol dehydrogenase family)
VVETLLSQGWNVTVFDFDGAAGAELADRLGKQVLFTQGNVIKYEDQVVAFAKTWNRWGRLDFGRFAWAISERSD